MTPQIGEIPPNVIGFHAVDLLWTLADSRRARREGWDVFATPHGYQIQPLPMREMFQIIFRTDLSAIEHCAVMADVSALHARALAIHFYSLTRREGP